MIYELRTYTCKQGTMADVAKNAGTIGRDIRKDDFGKLEGYWMSEIGHLNQVMHLWSYKDLNERDRLRGELAKNARWNNEYIPAIRPNLIRQEVRLLNAVKAPVAPATTPNLYELRCYRAKPGGAKPWISLFTKALEVREKYSKICALWTTESPQPNEIVHIWAYTDLNARAKVRADATKDAGWQAFLKESGQYLDEMTSTIAIPAAHSPLK